MHRRPRRFEGVAPGHPFALEGDHYYTRGLSGLSRAIRWAERTKGEAPSWANHAGIITRRGYLVPPQGLPVVDQQAAWASEALWHVENHEWWAKYKGSPGYEVALFRVRRFEQADRDGVVANALSRTGRRYGWWRLGTFLGEKLSNWLTFGKVTVPFSKLHVQSTRVVCSNHQALALAARGFYFGPHYPQQLDPDEGMDYSLAHPDLVEFVGRAVVPGRVLEPAGQPLEVNV